MTKLELCKFSIIAWVAALVLLWAGSAFCQSVALNEGGIRRSNGFRPSAQNPMWISKADCLADDEFTFPLTVGGYGGLQLEVWAGSASDDCTAPEARRGNTAVCWQLWKGVPTSTGVSVVVRSQDIVSRRKASEGATSGQGTGTADDCEWKEATTAPIEVGLYFMFVEAGSDQNQGGTLWTTSFDLAGPTPPSGVKAGIGSTMIAVSWRESTDTDRAGYRFFCDPSPNAKTNRAAKPFDTRPFSDDAGSDDASDSGDDVKPGGETSVEDAGVGEENNSSGSDDGCSSDVLVPGSEPDPAYACGSGVGTSGVISGLTNGVAYVVSVASVDGVGNVGKLANAACATPSQVDDFFTVYRDAGGRAGGGYCAVTSVGLGCAGGDSLVAFAAVVALVAGGGLIRRRRSR